MLDQLFGELATSLSRALGGPYFDAVVHYPGTPTFDDGGSIIAPGTAVELTCLAQVDVATDAMRLAKGFVDTDVRIMVLASSLVGVLTTDAEIEVQAGPGAGRYSVQSVARDPLGLGYECRGRRVG